MPERVETVRLVANVSNYLAGMDAARTKTAQLSDTSQAKLGAQRAAFTQLGTAAMAVGAVAAVGVGLAVARFAEFDQAMSNVKAVTQETTENMGLLRAAALDAGGRTVFTATEAANAIEELGKNGLTTTQILNGGLDAALDLAASGQLEVARAAEVAAITMKQFNLQGQDLPKVADLLAAGAGKAAGDVEDLAQALKQSGLVASQTGLSIEDTTGVLAAFADNALLGSDAGTSLRSMLLRLTPISGEAADEMDRLGINAYDANGQFIGITEYAGVLQRQLKGLTDEQRNFALAQIFGTDAVRAATVLYDQGAEGIARYIEQTNDSGYAAKVAADRLDNLRGDLEQLGGAFDTALIQTGAGANDVLRGLVQSATFLVNAFADLSPEALGASLAVGAVVASLGLVAGGVLKGIPALATYKAALLDLNISGKRAAVGIGGLTAALSIVTIVIGAFIAKQAQAAASTTALADSLDQTTGAVTDYTKELVVKRLAEEGAFDTAKAAGISQKELTEAVIAGGDAYDEVMDKLRGYRDAQTEVGSRGADLNSGFTKTEIALQQVSEEVVNSRTEWSDTASAMSEAEQQTTENEQALLGLEGVAENAREDIDQLAESIRNFGSASFDVRDASRAVEQSVDDLVESLKENGTTLDINTQAGRDNQSALDDVASSYLDLAAATAAQTGTTQSAIPIIEAGRTAFVNAATAAGMGADEANRLADELGLIPTNVSTLVTVNTSSAITALDELKRKLDGNVAAMKSLNNWRPPSFSYGPPSANGNMFSYASGGFGEGIYTGGAPLYKFAEPETRWEAFISGRPGQEDRNRKIWVEAGRRLGVAGAAGVGGGVTNEFTLNANGVDPQAVTEMVMQRVATKLVNI